jgi:1,6-anhydro-N-acetylmuramate kinase
MKVIGLMSGTSMDGVDVAVLETDGADQVLSGPSLGVPYPTGLRQPAGSTGRRRLRNLSMRSRLVPDYSCDATRASKVTGLVTSVVKSRNVAI